MVRVREDFLQKMRRNRLPSANQENGCIYIPGQKIHRWTNTLWILLNKFSSFTNILTMREEQYSMIERICPLCTAISPSLFGIGCKNRKVCIRHEASLGTFLHKAYFFWEEWMKERSKVGRKLYILRIECRFTRIRKMNLFYKFVISDTLISQIPHETAAYKMQSRSKQIIGQTSFSIG